MSDTDEVAVSGGVSPQTGPGSLENAVGEFHDAAHRLGDAQPALRVPACRLPPRTRTSRRSGGRRALGSISASMARPGCGEIPHNGSPPARVATTPDRPAEGQFDRCVRQSRHIRQVTRSPRHCFAAPCWCVTVKRRRYLWRQDHPHPGALCQIANASSNTDPVQNDCVAFPPGNLTANSRILPRKWGVC